MEDLMKAIVFACLLFWGKGFAIPIHAHGSGVEHIVIIDRSHPTTPQVAEVLERLALNTNHPDVHHVFSNSAFQGFSASMKSHCLDLLANMSDIAVVEKATSISRVAHVKRQSTPSLTYDTRPNAPWGLQRISTASAVGGSAEAMDYTYSFASNTLGQGVDIYIVDTGVYTQHTVFDGRATMAWSYDGNMDDLDGHGTHVSGTAAGDVLGVASNAKIYGIKALNSEGGGWSSNVIAGIDFIVQQHDSRKANGSSGFRGSVMSMSLASGSTVQALNTAIEAAVQAGVHTVIAAGNDDQDACLSSPASSGGTKGPAITVGSVGMTAQRSSFSNYGDCVDVYAPGENIISAWIGGPNMVNSLTGTSMATPHVTGIVAYAMGNATLAADPGLMKEWVRMTALAQSNGVALANNGVQADDGEGMLGYKKIAMKAQFTNVAAVEHRTPTRERRAAFASMRSITGCRGDNESASTVVWLCNTRRSTSGHASSFAATVLSLLDKVHVFP